MKRFPLNQLLPSWQLVPRSALLVRQNIEQTLFLALLPALLLLLGQILLGDITQFHHFSDVGMRPKLGLMCLAVGGIWSALNIGPALYFRIHAVRDEDVSLGTSYKLGMRFFWRLARFYTGVIIIVLAGFVAFIIPGIILLILYVNRYYLTQYYIVGHDIDVKDAMKLSKQETEPWQGAIWGILGVQFVASLLVGLLGVLGIIGTLAAEIVNVSLFFLTALRYQEICSLQSVSPATAVDKK